MRWATGITTAPRQSETLSATLVSLARAGWTEPHIFAEPHSPIPAGVPAGLVHMSARRIGPWENFLRALSVLVETQRQAEAYAILQDDIEVAGRLRMWLDANIWQVEQDATGLVSLYCAAEHHQEQVGWHAMRAADLPRKAYGALAYIFPSESARRIVLEGKRGTCGTGIDYQCGAWCKRAGLDYVLHSPSFVRHTGMVSTLRTTATDEVSARHERRFRQAAAFLPDVYLTEQVVRL